MNQTSKTIDLRKLESEGKGLVEAMASELEGPGREGTAIEQHWPARFVSAGAKIAPPRWGTRFLAAGPKAAPVRD